MKKALRILLMIVLVAMASSACASDAPKRKATRKATTTRTASKHYSKLKGTVGKYAVTMFLDEDFNGYYYYGNGSKGKLTLKAVRTGEDGPASVGLKLYEYNSAGTCTGIWDVWYSGITVEPGYRVWTLSGDMTTNGRTYDVDLWVE